MDHVLISDAVPPLPPGGMFSPGFIAEDEERFLIDMLDAGDWSLDLKRRVQHFGYRYDYRVRAVTHDAYLGNLPAWLDDLAGRLYSRGWFDEKPDQVIANEYLPGQGISAHVDCVPCFNDTIVSISLLSQCEMVFREQRTDARLSAILAPRSVVVLKGQARYDWSHEIPARKSDIVKGEKIARGRRISLTFRKVIRSL